MDARWEGACTAPCRAHGGVRWTTFRDAQCPLFHLSYAQEKEKKSAKGNKDEDKKRKAEEKAIQDEKDRILKEKLDAKVGQTGRFGVLGRWSLICACAFRTSSHFLTLLGKNRARWKADA